MLPDKARSVQRRRRDHQPRQRRRQSPGLQLAGLTGCDSYLDTQTTALSGLAGEGKTTGGNRPRPPPLASAPL